MQCGSVHKPQSRVIEIYRSAIIGLYEAEGASSIDISQTSPSLAWSLQFTVPTLKQLETWDYLPCLHRRINERRREAPVDTAFPIAQRGTDTTLMFHCLTRINAFRGESLLPSSIVECYYEI